MSSVTVKQFEPVTKTYSLSYFMKGNNPPHWPSNPGDCIGYYKQHGVWPFNIADAPLFNQVVEMYGEYQKRRKVWGDQHFTPSALAERLADIVSKYTEHGARGLDACAGFGMLSSACKNMGFQMTAFERDFELTRTFELLLSNVPCFTESFEEFYDNVKLLPRFKFVVSNPPFSSNVDIPLFFEQAQRWLDDDGLLYMILPQGFVDKTRPAKLVQCLRQWDIIHREKSDVEFLTTKVRTEILVMQKVAPGM